MLHAGCALLAGSHVLRTIALNKEVEIAPIERKSAVCLLYTSDAADE